MKTLIPFLAACCLLPSCATVIQGSKDRVHITVEPASAKIYVDDNYEGTGFATVNLKRSKEHTITVKEDNHTTRYVTVGNQLQAGWIIADIILLFPLSIIIDACTGSWHTFDKENYYIQLEKK